MLLTGLFLLGVVLGTLHIQAQNKQSRVQYNHGYSGITVAASPLTDAIQVTVNTTEDTLDLNLADGQCSDAQGKCSLRAAIMQANAAQNGSIITLPAGKFEIKIPRTSETNDPNGPKDDQADFDILKNLTIGGAGADVTVIDADELDSVFEIASGAVVHISHVTITNGKRPTIGSQTSAGGNVWVSNFSMVTLDHVIISGGEADYGGGIEVDRGGMLTMTHSAILQNHARLISGGLDIYGTSSKAILRNVTIHNNTSDGKSGGVEVMNGATLQTNNVTLTANQADSGTDGINLTAMGEISGNAVISNTLIASNAEKDCSGVFTSDGSNLISNPTSCTLNAGDIINVDTGLLSFGVFEPGVIPVHTFNDSSPAFNTGRNATCEATDARGVSRPQGTRCDIGAFEYVIPPAPALDLMINGGFEDLDEISGFPVAWKGVNLGQGDKVMTNRKKSDGSWKIYAYSDSRAFQFRGQPYENSRIVQVIDLQDISQGDTLELSGHAWSKNLSGSAKIRLHIKYADLPNEKVNLRVPRGSTGDYIPLSGQITLAGTPERVRVLVQFKGLNASGKFYIDDLSLQHTKSDSVLLPLPPSP